MAITLFKPRPFSKTPHEADLKTLGLREFVSLNRFPFLFIFLNKVMSMMDSLEYSAESRIDQLLSFNCLCGCLHVFILDIDSISEAWWLRDYRYYLTSYA